MKWRLICFIFIILFFCLQFINAQEENENNGTDDIEEAEGLDDREDPFNTDSAKDTSEQQSIIQEESTYSAPLFQIRGNTSAQLSFIPASDINSSNTGRGAASLNLILQFKPWSFLTLFCDINGQYKVGADSDNELNTEFLSVCNQAGFSLRPLDQLNITLGKELRIFAPGLFVYPSELIMPEENLPGLEGQMQGAWLLRCSYETPQLTVDTMLLPFNKTDEYGLPDLEAFAPEEIDVAARVLWLFHDIDICGTAGYLDTTFKAGCSFSTYIVPHLEIHGELGYTLEDEHLLDMALDHLIENDAPALIISGLQSLESEFEKREHIVSALLGTRWQIIDEIMLSLEGYYNGNGLTEHEFEVFSTFPDIELVSRGFFTIPNATNIFIRRFFVIAQVNFLEIYDLLNFQLTAVTGLEDGACLGFLKAEWLASSHSTLSISLLGYYNPEGGQYLFRACDWQLTGTWKTSF